MSSSSNGSDPADRYFKLREIAERKAAEDSKTPAAPANPNPQRRPLPIEIHPVKGPTMRQRWQAFRADMSEVHPGQAFKAFATSLIVLAIGGVLGDLGTSILYTFNEVFYGPHGIERTPENVLGVTSCIIWTLAISPTWKYLVWVFKAHHHNEGGPYALRGNLNGWVQKKKVVFGIGMLLIFAVCLMAGEAIITPAISVLAAVEGLAVVFPSLTTGYIDIISAVIIFGVFVISSKGTKAIGMFAGPVVIVWLFAAAFVGAFPLINNPGIFAAFNPIHAVTFLYHHGFHEALIILGGVVLCYTGGEAFWGDLGHFGAKALRWAWVLAFPLLLINYLGQGAYLLGDGVVNNNNAFYSSMPTWAQGPMVPLATAAAIIASFAMVLATMSAALGATNEHWLPPMSIKNVNPEVEGQVYSGFINWALCFGSIVLVFTFETSLKLAGAYGMSVTGTMMTTTLALTAIARLKWNWGWFKIVALFIPFYVIDTAYFGANLLKLPDGGWIPVVIGSVIMTVKLVWFYGRQAMWAKLAKLPTMSVGEIIARRGEFGVLNKVVFVLTGVEMTGDSNIPAFFNADVTRRGELPKHILFIHAARAKTPFVDDDNRYKVTWLSDPTDLSFTVRSVEIQFGYSEVRNVPDVLRRMKADGVEKLPPAGWIVMTGTDKVIKGGGSLIHRIHMALFALLKRLSPAYHEYLGFDGADGMEVEEVVNRIKA